MRFRLVLLALLCLVPQLVFATPMPSGCGSVKDCASCHRLTVDEAQKLLLFSKATVLSVKPAPSNGLFEVLLTLDGAKGLVYLDYGKRFLIQGQMIDLVNKTEVIAHEKELPRPKQFTGKPLEQLPVAHAMVLGPMTATKRLAVFTDPDCPHCRSLHQVLNSLVKRYPDLRIDIYLYPLKSLHPNAYTKARAVMASRSRKLLDEAFSGKAIAAPPGNRGAADVDAIIAFGEAEGIFSTPTILLGDGSLYLGPRTVEELSAAISQPGAVKGPTR